MLKNYTTAELMEEIQSRFRPYRASERSMERSRQYLRDKLVAESEEKIARLNPVRCKHGNVAQNIEGDCSIICNLERS